MDPLQPSHYIVDQDGKIKFTQPGVEWLGPYFAKAGIDLRTIKTYDEYLIARGKAGPYFLERIEDHLHSLPDEGEYSLLKSAFRDDDVTFEKKAHQHKLRKIIKVVK